MGRRKKEDTNNNGLILEQIVHQNEIILENLGAMNEKIKLIPSIVYRLNHMDSELKTYTHSLNPFPDTYKTMRHVFGS
jgi:hypothetical protein